MDTIAVYPESERERKIRSFYAQTKVLRDYLQYGEQKGDRYIVLRASAGIALFGGRLILAHNRILYPYHKWFMREMRNAAQTPPDFHRIFDAFLERPTTATCDAICDSIIDFMGLQQYETGFISRFVIDTEWGWRSGRGLRGRLVGRASLPAHAADYGASVANAGAGRPSLFISTI